MGVTYKLEPKIKDFILEQKNNDPALGCRRISELITDKFQVNISKSSINYIIKEAGLSMPVGRRQKKKSGLNPQAKLEMKMNLALPMKTLFLEEGPSTPINQIGQSEPVIINTTELPENQPVEVAPVQPVIEPFEECPSVAKEQVPQEPMPVEPPVDKQEISPAEKEIETHLEQPEAIIPAQEATPMEQDHPIEAPQEIPVQAPVEETVFIPVDKPVENIEPSDLPCSGAILLKAADSLIGGIYYIAEAIKRRFNSMPALLAKTEYFLYNRLKADFGLQGLVNYDLTLGDISSYLSDIQSVTDLSTDIYKVISAVFQEIRYVKVTLTDNSVFYLDGQLHTIWSTPSIPYDFSSPSYHIKGCLERYFQKDAPLILFMAPGYDAPTKEFFNFILTQQDGQETISRLTLCGNKFEELEGIGLKTEKRQLFVFGLWPWQFVEYRKVNKIGEYRLFHSEALNRDLYLAGIEIDLSQPSLNNTVTLSGCVLKTGLAEKARLIILSNLREDAVTPEDLADTYLNRWPNLEEAFKDYSRKIEVFTYTGDSRRLFSVENVNLLVNQESFQDINALFDYYLKALDLYVKWYFMPPACEGYDFSTMNERFYSLKTQAKRQKGFCGVNFAPPSGYSCLRELDYACRRVNEKDIILAGGKRLWFSL